MTRVCCTVGTWQLLTLVASLHQAGRDATDHAAKAHEDYLVASELIGVPEEFKQILHQMAEAIWPWKKIIWAYDLLTSERHFTQREFDRRRALLREKIGLAADKPDEVWNCFVNRPPEKLAFAAYPKAALTLYEDGLSSYVPQRLATRLDPAQHTSVTGRLYLRLWEAIERRQPVWRFRRSKWDVDPQHVLRLRRIYYLLTDSVRPPEVFAGVPTRKVDYACLREVVERAASVLPHNMVQENTGATILMLGQGLSRNGVISREAELALYEQMVETVLSKGYHILWKEHPRISQPFFEALKEYAGANAHRVTQLDMPHAFPIELVAPRLRLAGCVAGTSAALFYLKRLYNLPCYTFAESILPQLKGQDYFMGEMVRQEAPPLSALPENPTTLFTEG